MPGQICQTNLARMAAVNLPLIGSRVNTGGDDQGGTSLFHSHGFRLASRVELPQHHFRLCPRGWQEHEMAARASQAVPGWEPHPTAGGPSSWHCSQSRCPTLGKVRGGNQRGLKRWGPLRNSPERRRGTPGESWCVHCRLCLGQVGWVCASWHTIPRLAGAGLPAAPPARP